MKYLARTGLVIFLFASLIQSLPAQSIHEAIDRGDLQKVTELLSWKPELLESRNANNLTPLLSAAVQGRPEIVKVLLDRGADMEAGDNEGSNALHNAAGRGHIDILKLLVDRGADVNGSDRQGMTALHFACSRGLLKCSLYLISKGADLEAREQNDRTPLFFAAMSGSRDLCAKLIDSGAEVNVSNQYGRTPLTYAIWRNHCSVAKLLINHGADVDLKDKDGTAPLHLVCESGQADMVKMLMDKGADIRSANAQGCTPLHLAAMNGHREIIGLFLERGLDINMADDGGDTPIHCAAWSGDLRTVEFLIEHKADVRARNAQGKTPVDYAAQAGHAETVRLLKSLGAALNHQAAGSDALDEEIDENDSGEERPVTFTVLYDNYQADQGTRAEWGFACIVQGTEETILFDTGGEPEVLMHNVRHLGADLSQIDRIVISHIHWDHTGGLSHVLGLNHSPPVYVPRSFPYSFIRKVEKAEGEVIAVDEPLEICSHVYSTGEMGSQIKEQSLIVNTAGGLVIVTGCSHQGIANIVKKAKRLFDKEILLVFGGFHLIQHTDDQVKRIINTFRSCDVQKCGATHCTGDRQIDLFRQAYGKDYVPMGTGRRIRVSGEGIEVSVVN